MCVCAGQGPLRFTMHSITIPPSNGLKTHHHWSTCCSVAFASSDVAPKADILPEGNSATCIALLLVLASRRRRLFPDGHRASLISRHHVTSSARWPAFGFQLVSAQFVHHYVAIIGCSLVHVTHICESNESNYDGPVYSLLKETTCNLHCVTFGVRRPVQKAICKWWL